MASLFSNIGNQFASLGQLYGAGQNAQNAANQANTTYLHAQNQGVSQGSEFPSTNAQNASQSGFTGSFSMPTGAKPVAALPTVGLNAPKPMGAIAPSPQANVQSQSNAAPKGSSINTAAIQSQLAADKTQLASLQAQAAANPNMNSDGTYKNDSGTSPNMSDPYQNTGAPSYSGTVGALGSMASAPSAAYTAAQNQYNQANAQLEQLKAASANNQFIGAGTNMAEYAGTQGLVQNRLANQEAALTGEMSAAQAAAQTATGQQTTQQSGLGTAAGYEQPQNANALGTYNPTTGTYSGYGGSSSGASGAFGAGQVLGNVAAGQQFQQTIAPAYNAAISVGNQLGTFLGQNPNINPSDVNVVNQLNAWAQGTQLSNPKYPELSQYLNELTNTLSPLIGAPGDVTNFKQSLVTAMLNPSSSTGSIQQQIGNLIQNIALTKYQSIYGTGQSTATPTSATTYTGASGQSGNTFGSFSGS